MSNYVQEFKVPVSASEFKTYGIEDYASPGAHFFDGRDYKNDELKRFHLWGGGCGLGHAPTIEAAREKMAHYIVIDTIKRANKAERDLNAFKEALEKIGYPTGANIDAFKVQED